MDGRTVTSTTDVVWAKMKRCPYWPARIVTHPPEDVTQRENNGKQVCVYFFGTKNYGFVDAKNIASYTDNHQTYANKCKSNVFKRSLNECEEYLTAPKIANHISANANVITINTERSYLIKEEWDDGLWTTEEIPKEEMSASFNDIQTQLQQDFAPIEMIDDSILQLQAAKEKILHLKEQLRLKTSECDMLILFKRKAAEQMNRERKRFRDCAHENEILKATPQQSTTSVSQPMKRKKPINGKTAKWFEVEKLLKHKQRNGQWFFFVKWKNYGQAHNSWEPEKNLRCPNILLNYKTNHKL